MSVCIVSLGSLCRWQVQVSVYCARRIPVHLMCTQCSIMLHLMDICFLPCICLWEISQRTRLVWLWLSELDNFDITRFMRSSRSHPSGPHVRLSQNTVVRDPIAEGDRFRQNLHIRL